MITCFIRYELEHARAAAFDEYARLWGAIIPRQGVNLIGYFAPMEGSATTAYGVYIVPSLGAYEAYRTRLHDDPAAREAFAFARREAFIRREERTFLRLASVPHAPLVERP